MTVFASYGQTTKIITTNYQLEPAARFYIRRQFCGLDHPARGDAHLLHFVTELPVCSLYMYSFNKISNTDPPTNTQENATRGVR